MLLYDYRRCPYCIRARIALVASGLEVELYAIESLQDKPKEVLEHSPSHTVPLLLRDDGTYLNESLDIMRYALSVQNPLDWLGADGELADTLLMRNDRLFAPAVTMYKYKGAFHLASCLPYLTAMNNGLSEGYFLGDKSSLVDAAIFPFVRQFVGVDREWFLGKKETYPHLANWFFRFEDASLIERVMAKHPYYNATKPHYATL